MSTASTSSSRRFSPGALLLTSLFHPLPSGVVIDLPPFVTSDRLEDLWEDVVVCDVRMRPDSAQARREFEAGHLPGARFVDLNSDLAAPPGDVVGRHPLHDPVIFAATMGLLGIGIDTPVVAYDDSGGAPDEQDFAESVR